MKLVVTVLEETMPTAIEVIRDLDRQHDMVEVRAERFPAIDLHALRAATSKPIILTYRNTPDCAEDVQMRRPSNADIRAPGIDFIDIEWREGVTIEAPERTILSHHDFQGMRDVEAIWSQMLARGCAHTKLAATPETFADNERLLQLLRVSDAQRAMTVIGMSEHGLYARILAPFLGSELTFVAGSNIAAPGQLTLSRARDIYGDAPRNAERVFAVVGDPAGHSLSPSIHNRLFREKGVSAAYTIASFATFEQIGDGFLRGEPSGLSVTTPFKDAAFALASRCGAEIGEFARRARAVNTLVNVNGRILADNTDVDGFAALLPRDARRAAILGAGGTARAAAVALEDAGIPFTRFNRTADRADAPLDALAGFDGDLIINTLPGGVDVRIPPCRTYIEAAYTATPRFVDAHVRIGGLELLHTQAVRQHQLFMKVFDGI